MSGLFRHARDAERTSTATSEPPVATCPLVDWQSSLQRAEHACCCPARPTVVVIMPPVPGRPYPVDLLLCAHHYRVSAQALTAAGADVFDTSGAPLTTDPFALASSGR